MIVIAITKRKSYKFGLVCSIYLGIYARERKAFCRIAFNVRVCVSEHEHNCWAGCLFYSCSTLLAPQTNRLRERRKARRRMEHRRLSSKSCVLRKSKPESEIIKDPQTATVNKSNANARTHIIHAERERNYFNKSEMLSDVEEIT